MKLLFTNPLTDLSTLQLFARQAEVTEWEGRRALHLDGLALLPFYAKNFALEVSVAAEGPCYPGLAFRVRNSENYELIYAQPHTSGNWDALQYDPAMNGSNTWQVFQGPAYQKSAEVPLKRWFRLRLDVVDDRLAFSVDGQEPLVVNQLAYPAEEGQLGIWTYRPAYFSDWTVGEAEPVPALGCSPAPLEGTLGDWILNGEKKVTCEPNGCLALSRWLPLSSSPARLSRQFTLAAPQKVRFSFGFSDQLSLLVDGKEIFHGQTGFQNMQSFASRGYVVPGEFTAEVDLPAGEHELAALVAANEPFGWGFTLASEAALWWKA